MIYYIRNSIDDLIGFKYNDNVYYYLKNIQNDIIGILDSNCNLIVKYRYDSWGNILSVTDNIGNNITDTNHIGMINPFRYRSYYYDDETNLYYLNNRYYSSKLGRFLNADTVLGANQDIMAYNLYNYCGNNPITSVDYIGNGLFRDGWNALYNLGKNISKATRKTYNRLYNFGKGISQTYRKLKDSFVAEAGIGFGFSAGTTLVEGGFYEDKTIKYENGKVTKGSTISSSAAIKTLSGKAAIGFQGELFHEEHYLQELSDSIRHSQPYPSGYDIYDCEYTSSNYSAFGKINNMGGSVNEKEKFYGIDWDLHVVIGVHIKIGFSF